MPIPAGKLAEALGIKSVQADVDVLQARGDQLVQAQVEAQGIGGEAQFHRHCGHVAHDVHHVRPHQRFTAGEADLGDAVLLNEKRGERADLFPRHQLVAVQELLPFRHAVGAAQVALVHDADPQAAVRALMKVGEFHGAKLPKADRGWNPLPQGPLRETAEGAC